MWKSFRMFAALACVTSALPIQVHGSHEVCLWVTFRAACIAFRAARILVFTNGLAVGARALPYVSRAAEYMPQAMRAIDEDIARAHYLRDQATLRALEGIYGTDHVATMDRREHLLSIKHQ